jgi:hypothetical protein
MNQDEPDRIYESWSPDAAALMAALLEKASQAEPTAFDRQQHRWEALRPVYDKLRERGLSGNRAVEWLIEKGAISEAEYGLAKLGFQMSRLFRGRYIKYEDATNIAELLEMATSEDMEPVLPYRERFRWTKFFPVFQILKANGFRLDSAVNWFISQGVIAELDRTKVTASFRQTLRRERAHRRKLVAEGLHPEEHPRKFNRSPRHFTAEEKELIKHHEDAKRQREQRDRERIMLEHATDILTGKIKVRRGTFLRNFIESQYRLGVKDGVPAAVKISQTPF